MPRQKGEHGYPVRSPAQHSEWLRIDEGSSFVTVGNSTFQNDDDSTFAIFITTQSQGSALPHDIAITGNVFGANGSGRMIMTQSPNVMTFITYTVSNNRYAPGAAFLMLQCPSETNVVTSSNSPSG